MEISVLRLGGLLCIDKNIMGHIPEKGKKKETLIILSDKEKVNEI